LFDCFLLAGEEPPGKPGGQPNAARGAEPGAEPDAAAVSFHREVRPLLARRCQGCHQPAKAGGKLVLTSHAKLLEGAKGEPVVVPGDPAASPLVEEITPEEGKAAMPKDGAPLAAGEIDLIARWIAEGAKDDTPESARAEYSLENPPRYERLPVVTALDYSPEAGGGHDSPAAAAESPESPAAAAGAALAPEAPAGGGLLAVSGYHEVLLHKSDGSELVARLVGMSERIESVKFSPDGKRLAAAGGNPSQMGEVQIWSVEKRKLEVSVPVTYDTTYGVSWSRDGSKVAFGCGDNSVRAVDLEGNEVLFQGAHNDWVLGTTFSVDSSHLVSVSRDRSMKLIKVDTQQFIDNITSITPGALKGGLMAVDCHPTKDELLAGGADGAPKIFRMHREKARQIGDDYNRIRDFEPLPGRIFSLEFSADGSRIVCGSSSGGAGEVRSYMTDDGKLLWKLSLPSAIYTVAFSPDTARVAAAGFAGEVLLIDAGTGAVVKTFIPVPFAPVPAASAPLASPAEAEARAF
jgi:WD40 repeat protein